ncbi:MAG TPA: choice-of-anchor B family protein, partial [Bacteroidota bacterium]|nr:choice-of-anchor B family protein [Bacteroidota bacterium]
MRKSIIPIAIAFLLAAPADRSIAQESGSVRFLANYVPPSGGPYTAGCWGWTDSVSGREYALLGNYTGTSIVEITDVGNIVERDFIPGATSQWREIMTWGHYAYVVSEGGGGTQIIDLSYLPDSAHLVRSFIYTSGVKSTNRGHTVHTRDGYLYLNGCAQWSPGGVLIFDLADPENPLFTGEYARNYIHDCFVRNDTIFAAAIYGIGVDIIDVTDKYAPQYLYTIAYSGAGTHNTATTTDGRYVLSTDEINSTPKTLKIWDLSSPPVFPKVAEYVGSPTAIVHNVFVKETLAIMSYYTAGIRVVDISDPENPVELGGYDTRPADESASYTGAWSVYPYFPSGKIIIGDMGDGMFVVDMNTAAPRMPSGVTVYSDYATPAAVSLSWTDPALTVGGDTLTTLVVRVYRDGTFLASVPGGAQAYADSGLTLHQQYSYALTAVSGGDSSTPVTRTVYAGGAAQPAKPSPFRAVDLAEGVRLEWTNPSTQADGTPLNDLDAIEVYRDGVLLAMIPAGSPDTGLAASYNDTTVGYHRYRIRARDNETPAYYSSFTDSLLGYGGLLSSYSEDFETGGTGLLKTGTWDTTRALAVSGSGSMTDSP